MRRGGVDGRLHLLLGDVDVEIERELQRDDRAAEGAGGHHLVQAGHLPELALEGRCHRRRHDVRTGAGIEGEHLDGGIIDLRQRGNGQLTVGDGAGQHDGRHQQRRRDGPEASPPGVLTCTVLPARSLSTPSMTITSPADKPASIAASVADVGPRVTWRTSTVWSGFTVYTNEPCGPRWIPASGTMTAPFLTSSSRRAFTNWFGKSTSSSFGKIAFRRVVPVL